MRFRILFFGWLAICIHGLSEEWPVIDGRSPTQKFELVTIPAFETDPPNETPFRVGLRDLATKEITDSFLWEGDMGDKEAHKQNRALWSPNGDFLAVYMRSGRLSGATAYFRMEKGRLVRLVSPDAWQNVLGRFGTTQSGPNGGIAPVEWVSEDQLKISLSGSADTTDGRFPFYFYATLRFEGGNGVVPYIQLESVEPVESDSE